LVDYAERFGLGKMTPDLSVALGTNEVTLVQLVSVINTICSDGIRVSPCPIRAVVDLNGRTIYEPPRPRDAVMAPLTAHLMVEQLRSVVRFGTAFNLRGSSGFHCNAVGKTGTTNDEKDAWFVGAVPSLCAGVWVGFDQPESIHRSGSQIAIPLWARVMSRITEGFPNEDFPAHPDELETATIDSYDGLLANPTCPSVIRTAFIKGTAPHEACPTMHPLVLSDSAAAESAGAATPPEQSQEPGGVGPY
jgi:membrane carboxypeptidase/penicillin-binding protein